MSNLEEELRRQLAEKYGGVWGEHPDHSLDIWQYEVANDDTRAGY